MMMDSDELALARRGGTSLKRTHVRKDLRGYAAQLEAQKKAEDRAMLEELAESSPAQARLVFLAMPAYHDNDGSLSN